MYKIDRRGEGGGPKIVLYDGPRIVVQTKKLWGGGNNDGVAQRPGCYWCYRIVFSKEDKKKLTMKPLQNE